MSRFEIVNGQEQRIETARDARIAKQVEEHTRRIRERNARRMLEEHGTADPFEIG